MGFFCVLLGKREKRIGDWLAGTLVVQVDARPPSEGLVVTEAAKTIGGNLVEIMNFDLVSPDDFATVREYLQRRGFLTEAARRDVSITLARKIKEKTKLASLPTEMTGDTFLEAVYWSYQQRNR